MGVDVGLVTCTRWPELDPDSRLLLLALQKAGWSAVPVVWSDPAVDWSGFRICIVRSTWDYEHQRDRYVAWAEQTAAVTRLWNPPEVLRWNTDKRYLLELARKGVPIVPTVWIEAGGTVPYEHLERLWGTDRVVVKPSVSAGARHTFVVQGVPEPASLPSPRALLVQPYLDTVETLGEISIFYFGGEFSHAVSKKPKAGDFRVQEEHGGHYQVVTPTALERSAAEKVLHSIGKPLLYARIDMMYGRDGEPLLSEAEITEPSLYHRHVPESAARLVGHIERRLREAPAVSRL